MRNHYNVPKGNGEATPDPKFSDYCVNAKYIIQQKARRVKKKCYNLSTNCRNNKNYITACVFINSRNVII